MSICCVVVVVVIDCSYRVDVQSTSKCEAAEAERKFLQLQPDYNQIGTKLDRSQSSAGIVELKQKKLVLANI